MAGAATIVLARDDLSILGVEEEGAAAGGQSDPARAFFDLIKDRNPDVIVIDCRGPTPDGVGAIQRVRQQVFTPILIVCNSADVRQQQYRIAGAADCLTPPFDIVQFNNTVQQIIRLTRPVTERASFAHAKIFEFVGLLYRPYQNLLFRDKSSVRLTTAENQLLLHLITRPWRVCTRSEIAEVLYGSHRPINDRAIDLVLTRLRRKLTVLLGDETETPIRTEFRRGYMFASEVTTVSDTAA